MLILICAGLGLVQPCAGVSFELEETRSPATARSDFTATFLSNRSLRADGRSNAAAQSKVLPLPSSHSGFTTASMAPVFAALLHPREPNGVK